MSEPERLKISYETYRRLPSIAQSDLKSAYQDPQLYHERMIGLHEVKTTEAQWFGRQMEHFLKTGRASNEETMIIPKEVLNAAGHRRGSAWGEFKKKFEHIPTLMTESEWDKKFSNLTNARKNVMAHGPARDLLFDGADAAARWHHRYQWVDESTGMTLKAELDLIDLNLGVVTDIKTSQETNYLGFQREVKKWRYDVQAHHYLQVAQLLRPEHDWVFVWVVIKNKAPWNVEVYEMGESFHKSGSQDWMMMLLEYQSRVDEGNWLSPTHGKIVKLERD